MKSSAIQPISYNLLKMSKRRTKNSKGKDGIYQVPAFNAVTRRGVSPMQVALNRTPLLPTFVKVPRILYYDTNLSLSVPSTGAAITWFFTANGLYDPDITGTGHQPIGFDQLMLFYEQYTVTRSSIECQFWPADKMQIAIALAPDTTQITNPSQYVENGLVTFKAHSGFQTYVGQPFPNLQLSCDVKGYFGQKTDREMLNDVNLFGTVAANPTEQVYFGVTGWQGIGLEGADKSLTFDVLLSYDAIFWEPRKATESVSLEQKERMRRTQTGAPIKPVRSYPARTVAGGSAEK
jgi:hypothetical protein